MMNKRYLCKSLVFAAGAHPNEVDSFVPPSSRCPGGAGLGVPGPPAGSVATLGGRHQAVQTLRLCTRTGRPAGDKNFVAELEKRLGRPKKETKGQDDDPK